MIYFASDIHLGAGDRARSQRVERRFVQWLDRAGRDAEAIFLVGDIFDFWFEYRRVVPKGSVRALGKIAELTDRGIRVVFFTGNHDMWVQDYLHTECGMEIYTSPQEFTLHNRRLLIAHGDNLAIEHLPTVRLMNAVFRSRPLRWLFTRLIHPDLALRFGHWWSGKSRKAHHMEQPDAQCITEPLIRYARTYSQTHPIDCFIFGHLHVARDYDGGSFRALFLGEWETDPVCAVLDGAGNLTLQKIQP